MADPTLIIDFEPNWDSEPELSYGFLTAIQATPYFKEQRRPMVPTLSRIQSCKFTFIDEAMQRARHKKWQPVNMGVEWGPGWTFSDSNWGTINGDLCLQHFT